ncbi:MAG: translocation/assembly module TamB domain-containing protein [Magnetococcus sp. DMHC-6]
MIRGIARSLGILLLAIVSILLTFQSDWGREQLTRYLAALLSSKTHSVQIEHLNGTLPFDISLEHLTFADAQGVWLEMDQLHLDWSFVDLLQGRLHITNLAVNKFILHHLPSYPPEEQHEEFSSSPELSSNQWSAFLKNNFPNIEQLSIHRLELGEAVMGKAAVLGIQGGVWKAIQTHPKLGIQLSVQRLDEDSANLTAQLQIDLQAQTMAVDLNGQERGGLLAAWLNVPEAGEAQIRLQGEGPLSQWQGGLDIHLERVGHVQSQIQLAWEENAGLTMGVQGSTQILLTSLNQQLAPILGQMPTFAAQARWLPIGDIQVDHLTLGLAIGEVQAAGEITSQGQVQAKGQIATDSVALLSELAGVDLAGNALHLEATVAGNLADPKVHLKLQGKSLRVATVNLEQITAEVVLSDLVGSSPLIVTGNGNIHALHLNHVTAPMHWQLALQQFSDGRWLFSDILAQMAGLQLTGTTTLEIPTGTGTGQLKATLEKESPWLSTLDMAGKGGVTLASDFKIEEKFSRIGMDIKGEMVELSGLPEVLSALLGRKVQFTSQIAMVVDKEVFFSHTILEGKAARLEGKQIKIDLLQESLSGSLRVQVPDVGVLSRVAGEKLAGSLHLLGRVHGKWADPVVELDVSGKQLAISGQTMEQLTVKGVIRDLMQQPQGHVHGQGGIAQKKIDLDSLFLLDGSTLKLTDFSLSGLGATVAGGMQVELNGAQVTGQLKGEIAQLASLATLLHLDQDLSGRLGLDIHLKAGKSGQEATVTGTIQELQGGAFGRVSQVTFHGSGVDLLSTPHGEGIMQLTHWQMAEGQVEDAHLEVQGDRQEMMVKGAFQGKKNKPLQGKMESRIRFKENSLEVHLLSLSGQYAGEKIIMEEPTDVLIAGNQITLAPITVDFGPHGRFHLQGKQGLKSVEGRWDLTMPLADLERWGGPEMTGQLLVEGKLSGTPSQPMLEMGLDITKINFQSKLKATEIPKAHLAAHLEVREGVARLEGTLTDLLQEPAKLSLLVPVQFSLIPVRFSPLPEADVAGQLLGSVPLAHLDRILGLDRQRMAGQVRVDLTLAGKAKEIFSNTERAPQLGGKIFLQEGTFENLDSGTVLEKIQLEAVAQNGVFVIQKMSAGDGGKGKIEGSGEVRFNKGIIFDITSKITNFWVVRHEEMGAVMSGQLAFTGPLEHLVLTGKLHSDRVIFFLPDRLGPDIETISVTERGFKTPFPQHKPVVQEGGIDLDLQVLLPGQVFVRGRGLESEWGGDFRIQGTSNDPKIMGNLKVRRGIFDLLNHRFKLGEGSIELSGVSPIAPTIDLSATAVEEEMTAVIRVEGAVTAPTLTLTSTPELPQDEILSKLLFKRSTDAISPVEAVKLAAALNNLRGGGPGILDKVREAVGIDTFETGGDTLESGTVKVGKYIGDNLFLEVEKGMTAGSGKVRVEMEVLKDIKVNTEVDQRQNSAIGVQWEHQY